MISEQARFNQTLKTTLELFQIQDVDMLLERMLTELRKIANADAGSIFLVEGQQLKFSYTQNETMQSKLPFGKKLPYSTQYIPINNGSISGYVATTGVVVNVADAYQIDSSKPYTFNKDYDSLTGYHSQSILTVPIKTIAGRVIGVIQLINARHLDKNIRMFSSTEEPLVQVFADNVAIAIDRAQMVRAMITHMVSMIAVHDPKETVQHANRVGAYSTEIYEVWARKKGIAEREIQHNRDILRMAAMLHNIGKIAIPEEVLKNPDNPEIRNHTIYGARFFTDIYSDFDEMARAIALCHHERWDGGGYPGHVNVETGQPLPGYQKPDGTAYGKRGAEIPIYARIVALANVYDLLGHNHNGEVGLDEKTVLEKITADSGKFFDPDVVVAFLVCIEVLCAIGKSYPDPA